MDTDDSTHRYELAAALLLGIAAVLVAFAGYQSALWGGKQDTAFAESVTMTNKAADLRQSANTDRATDEGLFVDLVLRWVDSPEEDLDVFLDQGLGGFILGNMTVEGETAARTWLLSDEDFGPYPFDEDYWESFYTDSEWAEELAEVEFTAAIDANKNSDRNELAGTLLTTVMFLAGISVVIKTDRIRLALLVIAAVVLIGSTVYLATLERVF